jgi:hypothetical protein
MLQHLRTDDQIECVFPKGQGIDVRGGDRPGPSAVFTDPFMKGQPVFGLTNIILVDIRPDNENVFEAKRLARMAPRAAADIEDAKPGPDAQSAEVNGNHG